MPKKALKNIKVDEISLTTDEYVPIQADAKTIFYKSKKEGDMLKPNEQQAAGQEPVVQTEESGLIGKALDLVNKALGIPPQAQSDPPGDGDAAAVEKGKTIENYSSASQSTWETTTDEPAGQAVAKSEETELGKAMKAHTETIMKAFETGINPLAGEIKQINSRVETLEKADPGTGRIEVTDRVAKGQKFPEFTSFLQNNFGTPGQKLSKAAITTASFSYGLSVKEAERFIDNLIDQSVLLKSCRTEKLDAATTHIDKIGLSGKILKKATEATDPGETVGITTSRIAISAKEVIAIVRISDQSIRDNIEGEALVQHILQMMGKQSGNELEEAGMMGDTGVADTGILDLWDGWYKQAKAGGAHVIDASGDPDPYWPGTNTSKAGRLMKALPYRYRRDKSALAWIQNPDMYQDYEDMLAERGTGLGDRAIIGEKLLTLRRVGNIEVPLLPIDLGVGDDETFMMLTPMKNLITGIRLNVTLEPERKARLRCTDWVLTFMADYRIEEADAIAIYDKAKIA